MVSLTKSTLAVSVQLLQMAFLHIDVTSAGDNPISGGVVV